MGCFVGPSVCPVPTMSVADTGLLKLIFCLGTKFFGQNVPAKKREIQDFE